MIIIKNTFKFKLSKIAVVLLGGLWLSACSEPKAVSTSNDTPLDNVATPSLKNVDSLPHYLQRNIQDEVFYFVMPDRFNNGDMTNDQGSKTDPISAGGFDKNDKGMYHGGDIQGLQAKLPYIKKMGVSAIWLTPIMRNQAIQGDSSGYHGYWILDFNEIDPHLGSNEDLKRFIDAAHEENIKVFFDIITNHTADVIKYVECHGEDGLQYLMKENDGCLYKSLAQVAAGDAYQPIIPKGQESLKSPAWLNDKKYYHNQGDTTYEGENSIYGDFSGLDDIDTDSPEVVRGMIDIFKNVISEFKPDGFRIDTVKHVNMAFWAEFAPALVNHAQEVGIPEFFMFGEVYSGDSEELSSFTTEGKMQSVLDFSMQFALQDTLIKQQGTDKLVELFERDHYYNDSDSNANQLLNFTGNHDMGRFAGMLKDSDLNYSEAAIIQRTLLAHAMVYFLRGVPIVYYGDEQGFVGDGGDKGARQDMMPSLVDSYNDDDLLANTKTTADDNFDENHLFYKTFAKYADVYYQYPALRFGEQKTLYAQDTPGVFAISRTLKDSDTMVVVFNTAKTVQPIELDLALSGAQKVYPASKYDELNPDSLSVPALSFAIYKIK
ncbi:MAG: glycosidase [Colwellia sp.]|jgi:glycosidase